MITAAKPIENKIDWQFSSEKETTTIDDFRVYYEPDDDFYRSISADEFKERALKIVDKIFNK